MFFGVTVPANNLTATKKALTNLENELAQFSALAMSSVEADDETAPENVTLESILVDKSEKLAFLSEQLEGLKLISTADSNALAYIYAIEESTPVNVNVSSLTMSGDNLTIVGTSQDDTALATFCLRLRETSMFSQVFVEGTMVRMPGEKTSFFTITAILVESLDSIVLCSQSIFFQASVDGLFLTAHVQLLKA